MRALSQCLAREYQPMGVHVAHIIIDGVVGSPRAAVSASSWVPKSLSVGEQQQSGGDGMLDPDALAQTYWHLHIQDQSAWTQEIDVRFSSGHRLF